MKKTIRTAVVAFLALIAGTSAEAREWYVSSGQQLQPVLDDAMPGDTITLQAGAKFTGWHRLRKKSGSGWITIQSSALAQLPAGRRVKPTDSINMPKIIAAKAYPALSADDGAHHYRIIGVEFASVEGLYNWQLIELGHGDERTVDAVPSFIELDRLYIHGDESAGGKRGVTMNGRNMTLTNSYLCDFKSTWQDSNAVAGWNGPGPFTIENNYLEAAAENLAFGGSKPAIPNLVPSDITIRRNYLYKPLSWKVGHPEFAGRSWWVKNAFELKNARRVLFEGNVIHNVWQDEQLGYAIVLTVRTSNGTVPWAVVENVTVRRNWFVSCGAGINILGTDTNGMGKTQYITIQDNVVNEIDHTKWGGNGTFVKILNGATKITVVHNTVIHSGRIVHFEGDPSPGLVFKYNISAHNSGGISGSGTIPGTSSLDRYSPGYAVTANVLAGGSPALYPVGNFFPATLNNVGFVDMLRAHFLLAATSPYANGPDGKPLGADIAAVYALMPGVAQQ